MNNVIDKIIRALVEGNFCRKAIKKVDNEIAKLSRYCLAKHTKIQNNKIIFMTSQRKFMCNPKYIAQEILKQNLPYDLFWVVVDDIEPELPNNIRRVKKNSFQFYKEAASAKIWIDNSINFFFQNTPKSDRQILISTWHGSMGLKRIGKEDNKDLKWLEKAERCNKDTDYCISNSCFETNVYKETFWSDCKVLEYGHPRNDILFKNECIEEIKKKVCSYFGLDDKLKLALYAPTFRDSQSIEFYNIDYSKLRKHLQKRFGGEWVVLARHHFVLRNSKAAENSISGLNGVVQASSYVDMQELMLAADVGITDYSSWICDFVLTRKPAFVFATDLEEYNNERGLYYPLETTPFPVATNNDELMNNILAFDDFIYQKRIDEFLADKGCVEDGKASYRVVEKIKEIIGEK